MAVENSNNNNQTGGVLIGASGLGYLGYNRNDIKSKLTGRKYLYHTTPINNVPSILEQGLRGSEALNPNNATNTALGNAGIKDGRRLIYLGKSKTPTSGMSGYYKQKGIKVKTLRLSIPLEEYNRLRFTDNNPEFLGAKNADEWVKRSYLNYRKDLGDIEFLKKHPNNRIDGRNLEEHIKFLESEAAKQKANFMDRKYFQTYSGQKNSPTRIVEGDISSRFIKGGKGYKKLTPREVMGYIKKNPKRFGKGAGKLAIGTGIIGTGLWLSRRKN